jgi:hypothetical protein
MGKSRNKRDILVNSVTTITGKSPECFSTVHRMFQARKAMTGCPRVFTKEQMIAGLKSGKTFVVDRCDAPELPELLEMERAGLEESRFVEYDEQSSALKLAIASTIRV